MLPSNWKSPQLQITFGEFVNLYPDSPKLLPSEPVFGLFAPAGFLRQSSSIDQIQSYFSEKNAQLVYSPTAQQSWKYFSAPDNKRISDITYLVENSDIHAMMAIRGGYGVSRIIQDIPLKQIRQSGKIIVGFSDLTFLNMALLAKENYISFHGPMAGADFGNDSISHFTDHHFWQTLTNSSISLKKIEWSHPYSSREIVGQIWGGCLSILVQAIGTPYFPSIKNGILFIEDIGEEPYRIERMLLQLLHSGVLEQQQALLLGHFTDCIPGEKSAYPYSLDDVWSYLETQLSIPILHHFPFGHVADKITIPYGAKTILTLQKGGYSLKFKDYLQ